MPHVLSFFSCPQARRGLTNPREGSYQGRVASFWDPHAAQPMQSRSGLRLFDDDDGLHCTVSFVIPHPATLLRRALRVARRVLSPSSPSLLLPFLLAIAAVVGAAPADSRLRYGWMPTAVLREWASTAPSAQVGAAAAIATCLALFLLLRLRLLLLLVLLHDNSWLYAGMGRTPFSWPQRAWFIAVKALVSLSSGTFALESAVPRAPVPPLRETVSKYLEYARVIQTDEEFIATEAKAADFLAGDGPRLQRYLILRSWLPWVPHYMSAWWEAFIYLKGRSPIPIHSNYYILDSGRFRETHVQEARAAVFIHAFVRYNCSIQSETLPPVVLGGAVPTSMDQFRRMFASTRVPGRETDHIQHYDPENIKHVAVACRGSIYKLQVYAADGVTPRAPDDLEAALTAITLDAATRFPAARPAEALLPVLTSDSRGRWAEVRELHFSEGVNRRSLRTVESALFYVALETESYSLLNWTDRAKHLFHGNADTPHLWFDKSLTLVIFRDGKAGMNCEHSWADAPVPAHLMEVSGLMYENTSPYNAAGHVMPTAAIHVPSEPAAALSPAKVYVPGPVPYPGGLAPSVSMGTLDILASQPLERSAGVGGAPVPALRPHARLRRVTAEEEDEPGPTEGSGSSSLKATPRPATVGIRDARVGERLTPLRAGEAGWVRLSWQLSADCEDAIASSHARHREAIANLSLTVFSFDKFGKVRTAGCAVHAATHSSGVFPPTPSHPSRAGLREALPREPRRLLPGSSAACVGARPGQPCQHLRECHDAPVAQRPDGDGAARDAGDGGVRAVHAGRQLQPGRQAAQPADGGDAARAGVHGRDGGAGAGPPPLRPLLRGTGHEQGRTLPVRSPLHALAPLHLPAAAEAVCGGVGHRGSAMAIKTEPRGRLRARRTQRPRRLLPGPGARVHRS